MSLPAKFHMFSATVLRRSRSAFKEKRYEIREEVNANPVSDTGAGFGCLRGQRI